MNCKVVASLLLLSASLFGQTAAGVSSISGVVRDPSGAAVPNAKVVIATEGRGTLRNLVTNNAGVFAAPALAPGAGYDVTVTAAGFTTYEMKSVELLVGQNLDLSVKLTVGPPTTQIEVTSTAPMLDDTKTDVSAVVGTRSIQELPINGRRVDSFVLLTPGVSNDGTFGLLTFRGVAGQNSFLIDGNDTTEQFYNENAGRTRIASQISQDAVQEFQVVSSNYSAEYGRAMGGIVNTVTRSGSNEVHGTGYWFFRNQNFNAKDTFAAINPHEVRNQAGASIGGAIQKDKLFYFFNGEFTRRNFPMVDSNIKAGIIDPVSQSWIGCGAPATPAQCQAINGLLPRFFATLPRKANQDLLFGRLDYHLSDRNTLSASMNFLHFTSPNGIQTGVSSTTGAGITSNGDDSVQARNGRLSWTFVPNSGLVNEFHFGYFADRQADTFNNASLGQGLGLLGLTVATVTLGPANYLPRVEPSELRFQFGDNASWTRGTHTVKFGADIASTEDYTYFIQNAFGNYTYQNVTNFALDYTNQALSTTNVGKHWQTFAQTTGQPVVDATIRDYGFYLQDEWRATSKLTVNVGARYEYAQLPQPPMANPAYPQTGVIHSPKSNIMPRVGLAYRLNDKTVARAGFGMFYARFQGATIDNLWSANGIYQQPWSLAATQPAQFAAGPAFPSALMATPGVGASATSIQFADPNFKTPYSEQGNVALERQLGHDTSVTASYIWSRGVDLYSVRDLNLPVLGSTTATYTIADANGNPTGSYTTPVYTGTRPDTRFGGIYQDENGVTSSYNALAVQARKRFSAGFQADVAYTWSHEIDDGQGFAQSTTSGQIFLANANYWVLNGNYKNEKANGLEDQRHRFVMSFVWSPTITHRSGAFFKYVVNNWQISGITTLQSGRPYTSPTIRTTDTPVTGMFSNTTLNGSGLSFRVPFLPANGLMIPAAYRTDARLSKLFPLTERFKMYLNFEVFNVSNSWSPTAVSSQMYTEAKGILTLTPTAFGIGTGDGGFPDGTQARRMQVSARLVF